MWREALLCDFLAALPRLEAQAVSILSLGWCAGKAGTSLVCSTASDPPCTLLSADALLNHPAAPLGCTMGRGPLGALSLGDAAPLHSSDCPISLLLRCGNHLGRGVQRVVSLGD